MHACFEEVISNIPKGDCMEHVCESVCGVYIHVGNINRHMFIHLGTIIYSYQKLPYGIIKIMEERRVWFYH